MPRRLRSRTDGRRLLFGYAAVQVPMLAGLVARPAPRGIDYLLIAAGRRP